MTQKTDNCKATFLPKEFTQHDIHRANLEGMASAYTNAIMSFLRLVVEDVGSYLHYNWREINDLEIVCYSDLVYAMSRELGRNYPPIDGEVFNSFEQQMAYNRIEQKLYTTNRRGWSHKRVTDYFPQATDNIPAITWCVGAGFIAQYSHFTVEADFNGDWKSDLGSCQEYLLQWRMYNELFGEIKGNDTRVPL